jgi:hypothetical protein
MTEEQFQKQEALRLEMENRKNNVKKGTPLAEDAAPDFEKLSQMIKQVTEQAHQVQSLPIIDSRLVVDTIREIAVQYNSALQWAIAKIKRVEENKKLEEFEEIIGDLNSLSNSISDLSSIATILQTIQGKLDKLSQNADLEKQVLTKLNSAIDKW